MGWLVILCSRWSRWCVPVAVRSDATRVRLQLVAAALLLALAGYAWQGRPQLAGRPKPQAPRAGDVPDKRVRRTLRPQHLGRFDRR